MPPCFLWFFHQYILFIVRLVFVKPFQWQSANNQASWTGDISICLLNQLICSVSSFFVVVFSSFFTFQKRFIFLAVLSLRYCARAFSRCGGGGCSSLWRAGFSSRWLLLLQSTGLVAPCHVESSWTRNWACVPALAGGFLTTGPPGKLQYHPLVFIIVSLQSVSLWPLCRLSSSCFLCFYPLIFLSAVVPSYLGQLLN